MMLIKVNILESDEKLPSLRDLSNEISVNVNTIKKAFSDLEEMGVVYSVPGKGYFVSDNAFSDSRIKEKALDSLRASIKETIPKCVTRKDIEMLLDEIFKEDEK